MSISAGTRLGPYEILAMIGAGGMGEVYRARDPRMGREVAIKVSAERFSGRSERERKANDHAPAGSKLVKSRIGEIIVASYFSTRFILFAAIYKKPGVLKA
jgi:serine/threonine protein kinase